MNEQSRIIMVVSAIWLTIIGIILTPGCIRDRTPVINAWVTPDSTVLLQPDTIVREFDKYIYRPRDGAFVGVRNDTLVIKGEWIVMRNGRIIPEEKP